MSKIFLAISNHSRMLGGGEHSFLDLLAGLPDHWIPIAAVASEGLLAQKLRRRSIRVEMTAMPPIRPWLLLKLINCLKSYCRFCRKCQVALIYANGPRAAFYGGLVGRILGIPVVWHCRITKKDPIFDFMLTKMVSKVVVNSKATAKRFHSKHREKIAVVYNGIPIRWFKQEKIGWPEPSRPGWKSILLVARVSKSKRHDIAIDAFEQVAESDCSSHLICVGERDHSQSRWWNYLQRRSATSKYSERIHWIGNAEDIRPWYKVANLMIFPAESEGFGRVLVEAMTCGVPVIATCSGGIPEIVRDGKEGILVSPGKVLELAEAMTMMLNDNVLKQKLTRAGRKRANLFDLEVHVKHMVKVFEQLVED